MADHPRLIVQVARGGAVERQLSAHAPEGMASVEAAEELRDDELAVVLEAAGHTPRAVILRVMRDG